MRLALAPLCSAIVLMAACTAAPPLTPCQRECGRLHDACMDVSGIVSSAIAMETVSAQCDVAYKSCDVTCQP